jgi:hypothetical protein
VLAAFGLTLAATVLLAWLSLHDVPGRTRGGERVYVHGRWFLAMLLLAVPVGVVARQSRRLAMRAAGGCSCAAIVVGAVVVDRYRSSGNGDGLEVLIFVPAVVMIVLWFAVADLGSRPRERSQSSDERS